ncbi:MAG: sigma 54-interacting transcriptional regulator [Archangiaceae bacterium]|nr:sigma 54-interacting transcriptional regulator [Archangiaceae bacterium]
MSHEPSTTLQESSYDDLTPGGGPTLRLLVFSGDTVTHKVLPVSGELRIGRAEECDVWVDVPALSRHHALLRMGPPVTVEDLGSSNGTRVRGKKLEAGERARVVPGESIDLGAITLVVQRISRTRVAPRPRRLWSHAYFEGRLEEECSRAEASGVAFTVLRIALEGAASPAVVQQVLVEKLEPTDLIAAYGPGEYEAMVFGTRAKEAVTKVAAALEERGAPVRIGHAVYGVDGRDPDRLFGEACARIEQKPTEEVTQSPVPGIVVKDPQMEALHALVKRVAQSDIPVLLLGETGVGKEVFAESVHQGSARKRGPFLRLNCAALTETLLESELFGHEKGAFTGAVKTKVGLLESATSGTVLLDEIGEMPIATQAKLLRVLEQKEVIRVGDVKPRAIDVRFVAATHRDLESSIEKGTFRKDLYFRLNGVTLVIPPLRERVGEIESMARHFIARAARQFHRSPEPTLSAEALAMLRAYAWPGNLREMRNVLERATLLCNGNVIGPDDLPGEKFATPVLERERTSATVHAVPGSGTVEFEAERQRIMSALETHGGNQTLAAKQLGISRRTMLNRLDAYAIPRPRKGKG